MNDEVIEYKENDVITLDDIDYLVVDRIFFSGQYYLYLADIKNPYNYMYVEDAPDEIVEVVDEELLEILIKLVVKKDDLQDLLS